jgi:hypothetical protein
MMTPVRMRSRHSWAKVMFFRCFEGIPDSTGIALSVVESVYPRIDGKTPSGMLDIRVITRPDKAGLAITVATEYPTSAGSWTA